MTRDPCLWPLDPGSDPGIASETIVTAAPSRGALFAAIPLPPSVHDALEPFLDCLAALTPRAQHPATPADLHLTLRYFGVPGIDPRHAAAAVAAAAAQQRAFLLTLGGLGCFGPPATPRVLWLGALAGTSPLTSLAMALCGVRGLFVPHVTVAKARKSSGDRDLASAAEILDAPSCGPFCVTQLELWRRAPSAEAGRYETLAEFPLRS